MSISDNPVEAREILGSLLWTDGHSYRGLAIHCRRLDH
jgi:hypothetical protein